MRKDQRQPAPGITLVSADNFEEWLLDIKVLDQNPLYLDQTYRLKFKFSPQYPIGKTIPSGSADAGMYGRPQTG